MQTEKYRLDALGRFVPVDAMQCIMDGLHEKHVPCEEGDPFVEGIYLLFNEYCSEKYTQEWNRLDDNTRIYQGDHWRGFGEDNPENRLLPRPSVPTITSAIENLKADLNDEFPEAIIVKDSVSSEEQAKVLTAVVRQELDLCGWELEYGAAAQDFLQDGWCCFEIGYDPDANLGMGGSYIRTIMNKNFMCDPQVKDLQDGRACFKLDMKPRYWFKQHYPEAFKFMRGDKDEYGYVRYDHETGTDVTKKNDDHSFLLIECWIREYDANTGRHKVHFVKVAGHQILECSTDDHPNGYYRHGQYPFVVTALFPQRGTELGIGIVDLFKDAQRYSDKALQIILTNLFRAAKPRMILDKNYLDDDEDVTDMTKEIIYVKGNVSQAYAWQQPQPLPNTSFTSIDYLTSVIKNESGTNDQSRGQTGAGVTAASAITALQEMSTKRSRMAAQKLAFSFRKAVIMLLSVLEEMHIVPREVPVTVNGEQRIIIFDRNYINTQLTNGEKTNIVPFVQVKSARQTRYSKMMHNELVIQMMNATQGTTDPVLMFEGFEYDEKENLLDLIHRAQRGGMLNLQKQVAEQAQMLEQMGEELAQYKQAMASANANMQQMAQRQQQASEEQMQAQGDAIAQLTAENMQ